MSTGVKAKQGLAVEIKVVPEADYPQAADLWSLAFAMPGSDPARGRAYGIAYAREQVDLLLGAFEQGKLCAVVAVIDFQARFAGRWVSCAGIAGVASQPGQRRHKLVNRLLAETMKILHDRQTPLAALRAFSFPFYERMGWAVTDWHYSIEVAVEFLKYAGAAGDSRNYSMLNPDQFQSLMPLHERWMEQSTLSFRRNEKRWKHQLEHPEVLPQLFEHDNGYMLWNMKQSQPPETLVIQEWAHLSPQAFLDGLALLSNMDSQFKRVRWTDSNIESFTQSGFPYPKPDFRLSPGMMTRVVNMDAFQKLLPEPLPAGLKVVDPLGIAGDTTGQGIGPGQLVQLVTAFWNQLPENWPASVQGLAGGPRAFSIEQY